MNGRLSNYSIDAIVEPRLDRGLDSGQACVRCSDPGDLLG